MHTNTSDTADSAGPDSAGPDSSGSEPALPHRWARSVLIITGCYFAIALLPLILPRWWLSDLLANLRVQLFIAAILLLIALAVTRCRRALWLLSALTIYHATWFVSPAKSSPVDATLPTTITVMAANVFTGNQMYDVIEGQIRDSNCDVVLVSELSFGLARYLGEDFIKDYPHFVEFPANRGNFGIGMYSRFPFENASIEFLTNDLVPTVLADVKVNESDFHIVGVHTLPPMGKRMFEHRNRHLKLIADHVRKKKQGRLNQAVIVMGDLNLTPWSPVFTNFLGDTGLSQANQGGSLQPTWYGGPGFPFGLVLDHVLLSDQLVCISRTIGESAGSDHRFVTVEIGASLP